MQFTQKQFPGLDQPVNVPTGRGRFIDKFMPESMTASDLASYNKQLGTKLTPELSSQILKDVNPGFFAKYAAPAAAATTVAAAGGFFDAPEMEELEDIKTGQDLIDENRGKYIVQGTDIRPSQPPFMVPTRFPFTTSPPVQNAAEGGEAKEIPRRNGGIGMDEGTPGKDRARSMTMPGEVAMRADADNSRGAGAPEKGINEIGARRRN